MVLSTSNTEITGKRDYPFVVLDLDKYYSAKSNFEIRDSEQFYKTYDDAKSAVTTKLEVFTC